MDPQDAGIAAPKHAGDKPAGRKRPKQESVGKERIRVERKTMFVFIFTDVIRPQRRRTNTEMWYLVYPGGWGVGIINHSAKFCVQAEPRVILGLGVVHRASVSPPEPQKPQTELEEPTPACCCVRISPFPVATDFNLPFLPSSRTFQIPLVYVGGEATR